MYYIVNGMGKNWKWLAILFAAFAALASFGIGNLSQANSITGSINNAITAFYPAAAESRNTISLVAGIIMALLTAAALFGGIKRIGKVTELLVPFMSILYIIFTVIVANFANIGNAFQLILTAAFAPRPLWVPPAASF